MSTLTLDLQPDALTLATLGEKDRAQFTTGEGEPYTLGPDSLPQDGVPRGEVTTFQHTSERVYPGVWRECSMYTPAGYDASKPAPLMIFQDGPFYLDASVNAPVVFDNLIHKGEIPALIGLFASPGDKGPGTPIYGGTDNRSFEYDTLSDQYARFLIEELLPEVETRCPVINAPAARAICGHSSGGICAFTAAWQRPDVFGKVFSTCGSFTSLRGGHIYPTLIRRSESRLIRVFLQGGSNDLDVIFGNWAIANQDMASALAYRGYDYQFVYGEGGHTLRHGASIFPDALRWLWRDYPTA